MMMVLDSTKTWDVFQSIPSGEVLRRVGKESEFGDAG
jgi:hypothetical protein